MTVPFMYNFSSSCNKFSTIFASLIFRISLPRFRLFFVEKRKPKILEFKKAMDRGIRKCLTFVTRQIASKIFGKIILKPL